MDGFLCRAPSIEIDFFQDRCFEWVFTIIRCLGFGEYNLWCSYILITTTLLCFSVSKNVGDPLFIIVFIIDITIYPIVEGFGSFFRQCGVKILSGLAKLSIRRIS